MPPNDLLYTTGPCQLPDDPTNLQAGVVGTLVYSGCIFSPLFDTSVSGRCIQDDARRTIKLVEYTITANGYVTLPDGDATIGPTMADLYSMLTEEGGTLVYVGRGLDFRRKDDYVWGPVPELLEFQPLGGGLSAKVTWRVTVRLAPSSVVDRSDSLGLLQMSYDTSVRYGDDGYSSFAIKGVVEIPLNYTGTNRRVLTYTVDDYRNILERRVLAGIDLGRFHLTDRTFSVSRDKRTLDFSIAGEEKRYMDLPIYCTKADGEFTFRPAKIGAGLSKWLCTLTGTYIVARGAPRWRAYVAFVNMLNLRMNMTALTPSPFNPINNNAPMSTNVKSVSQRCVLIDFSGREGLYSRSDYSSFSATWRIVCSKEQILLASGMWSKVPEGINGVKSDRREASNLWALSMRSLRVPDKNSKSRSIMGAYSWLPQTLDPKLDVVIDFGTTNL